MNLFHSDKDRYLFLRYIAEAKEKYGITFFSYCLMDNHIHLGVKDKQIQLPDFMRDIKSRYAGYHNKEHHFRGHLFQERYQFSNIINEKGIIRVARYNARNPVKAGLLNDPLMYYWSSASKKNDKYNIVDYTELDRIYNRYYSKPFETYIRSSEEDHLLSEAEMRKLTDGEAQLLYNGIISFAKKKIITDFTLEEIEHVVNSCRYKNLSTRQISKLTGLSKFKIDKISKPEFIYI